MSASKAEPKDDTKEEDEERDNSDNEEEEEEEEEDVKKKKLTSHRRNPWIQVLTRLSAEVHEKRTKDTDTLSR
jgi:hypothetical protein